MLLEISYRNIFLAMGLGTKSYDARYFLVESFSNM
jgi:hypothetical protein